MTVTYNHLNLPKLFTWTGGSFNGNSVEILYDAAGTKLKKTVKTGATVNYTQEYLGGIEYRDGVREAIYTAEGRIKYPTPSTTRYEYSIKDHLGNARISFSDLNGNGVVNETNNPTTNEVLQENHYYPFGLNTDGPWMNDAALDNKYQYNGKEWNDDFALNLNDYGARWYDAAVGRWNSVDPLGGLTVGWSNYAYTFNNPISFSDPTGMTGEEAVGADGLTNSQWIESSRPGSNVSAKEQRRENREKEMSQKQALPSEFHSYGEPDYHSPAAVANTDSRGFHDKGYDGSGNIKRDAAEIKKSGAKTVYIEVGVAMKYEKFNNKKSFMNNLDNLGEKVRSISDEVVRRNLQGDIDHFRANPPDFGYTLWRNSYDFPTDINYSTLRYTVETVKGQLANSGIKESNGYNIVSDPSLTKNASYLYTVKIKNNYP